MLTAVAEMDRHRVVTYACDAASCDVTCGLAVLSPDREASGAERGWRFAWSDHAPCAWLRAVDPEGVPHFFCSYDCLAAWAFRHAHPTERS